MDAPPKADPKPDPTPDPELARLAAEIAGEPEPIIEGKDSVSPDKPAEGEPPPGGEPSDKPEGEPEDPDKDGPEDQFKDLAGKPDEALKALLEHSVLGPILNRWLDKALTGKVTAALEDARPGIEADTKRTEAERIEDAHFSGMTKEQIAEEISGDEAVATAYARYQQRKEAGATPNAKAVAQASQLYSYASDVAAVSSLLKESELTTEVKETLKPDKFTHLGPAGIGEWKKAVFSALVAHEASGLTQTELDAKWEAYKEEHLAEIDGERPAVVSGRRDGPKPDLLSTSSDVLLESALSKKPAGKDK